MELSDFVKKVSCRGRITFGDIKRLQRDLLPNGAMTREDVRTDLAGLVSGVAVRRSPSECVVFDSTGTALQDVAAAAITYERSCERGIGLELSLAD